MLNAIRLHWSNVSDCRNGSRLISGDVFDLWNHTAVDSDCPPTLLLNERILEAFFMYRNNNCVDFGYFKLIFNNFSKIDPTIS